MSDVVVDASLAAQWIVQEKHTTDALALLRQWDDDGVRRVVPLWFACELGNVFYKRVIRGLMTVRQAQNGVDFVLAQVVMLDDAPSLTKRALELADALNQSASYDAHYVALAERLDCDVWTADERFWNSSRATLTRVRWVGEVVSQ